MIKLSTYNDNNGIKEIVICAFTDFKKILEPPKERLIIGII